MMGPRIDALLDALAADGLPAEALAQGLYDAAYGEYRLAFENLCEALYEGHARLSGAHLEMIRALADAMGVEPDRWEFLEVLRTQDCD